jgi:hypothetical protein
MKDVADNHQHKNVRISFHEIAENFRMERSRDLSEHRTNDIHIIGSEKYPGKTDEMEGYYHAKYPCKFVFGYVYKRTDKLFESQTKSV